MLEALRRSGLILPQLLKDEHRWKSVFVDYHHPYVERVWCDWEGYRVYLHRIHPCSSGEALFHPHPWPSAMKVESGRYEMCWGLATSSAEPPITVRRILAPGSEYEMIDPYEWHSVRPLDGPSISRMITGTPWESRFPKPRQPVSDLAPSLRTDLLEFFRSIYH